MTYLYVYIYVYNYDKHNPIFLYSENVLAKFQRNFVFLDNLTHPKAGIPHSSAILTGNQSVK